jgi:K+-transporting ATPase ATPase C chain
MGEGANATLTRLARSVAARQAWPALAFLLILALLGGLAYPLAVAGLARAAFPFQAGGSLLRARGRVVGSSLVGQDFTAPGDFWGRPSATAGQPCNGAASGASGLAPSSPGLRAAMEARVAMLRAADPGRTDPIPVDLVTASGSGLDPHISPEAALWQAHRVARARGLPEARVRALVKGMTRGRQMGILGEPRVDVQELNLALDGLAP